MNIIVDDFCHSFFTGDGNTFDALDKKILKIWVVFIFQLSTITHEIKIGKSRIEVLKIESNNLICIVVGILL